MLGFPQLFMPPPESGELLSPLRMDSPVFPKTSTASPSPLARDTQSQPLVESPTRVSPIGVHALAEKPTSSAEAKGKARAEPVDLDELLSDYLRSKNLQVMKRYYTRWEDKTIERAQWMEACERGEAYKAKIRKSLRIPPTFSTPAMQSLRQEEEPKKRRMSAGEVIRPRRMRRSAAHYEHPLTDEELARRLKEVRFSLAW